MDELSVSIDYTFSSSLGEVEEYRYIKTVKAKIYNGEYQNSSDNEFIGIIDLTILLLDYAKRDEFDIIQIFDNEEYTYRLGSSFYNFKTNRFKKAVYNHYEDGIISDNVCFIERMYIKPAFRGKKIGPKLFKDLVTFFSHDAAIFVIQPFPLQFDETMERDNMAELFELKMLESDKCKSLEKLKDLYISWGFEKIDGIKDILFYNAEVDNEKFDSITLEE